MCVYKPVLGYGFIVKFPFFDRKFPYLTEKLPFSDKNDHFFNIWFLFQKNNNNFSFVAFEFYY